MTWSYPKPFYNEVCYKDLHCIILGNCGDLVKHKSSICSILRHISCSAYMNHISNRLNKILRHTASILGMCTAKKN